MSPDPFDDIDRALATGLSALAPEVEGGDETLAALRPRFKRARTRNRVTKAGGVVLAVGAIALVATIAAPRSGRTHVRVSAPPTTSAETSQSTRPSTTTSSTTSVPTVKGSTPTSVGPPPSGTRPSDSSPSGPAPTTPGFVPATTPDTSSHGGGNSGHSGGGNGGGRGPSTGTSIPASGNEVHQYTSEGGSIRVRYSNGALSLVSVSPANGYQATTHNSDGNEIDVRFEGDHDGWRIRVRLENGRPTYEVGHD